MDSSVGSLLRPLGSLLTEITLEELVMIFCAVIPLSMGLGAASKVLTRKIEEVEEEQPKETKASGPAVSADLESAVSGMESAATRVEQQMVSLQRFHDAQFADVHKDLAGIVWELSKLRADMARWQVRARASSRGGKARERPHVAAGHYRCADGCVLARHPYSRTRRLLRSLIHAALHASPETVQARLRRCLRLHGCRRRSRPRPLEMLAPPLSSAESGAPIRWVGHDRCEACWLADAIRRHYEVPPPPPSTPSTTGCEPWCRYRRGGRRGRLDL